MDNAVEDILTTTTVETSTTKSVQPIRAKDETTQRLLEAARDGRLEVLQQQQQQQQQHYQSTKGQNNNKLLREVTCTSGCTLLHWAAGANQIRILEYLTGTGTVKTQHDNEETKPITDPIFDSVDCPIQHRKAQGRTPLHYSCRNGHLETTRWLIQRGANPHHKAKHGVTPFQLAVWQNHLAVCRYLVQECHVIPAHEINDFDCGPFHWLGIAPVERANFNNSNSENNNSENNNCGTGDSSYEDGRDLLPLAEWLAKQQPNVDVTKKQRQGHSALHKASWGGHLALVQYLHIHFDMMDDTPDHAGNYAASLADMAQTARHDTVARYLRTECSVERRHSCALLGVPLEATDVEIRRAYLQKARELHPDKQQQQQPRDGTTTPTTENHNDDETFHQIQRAYKHLMEEQGRGTQRNPAHSLPLMLQLANNNNNNNYNVIAAGEDTINDQISDDGSSFFKAKLLAVLLEYGDKGMDVSNIKKKWNQVWGVPFPEPKPNQNRKNKKKSSLSDLLLERAGDVIRVDRDRVTGTIKVFCKQCSRETVVQASARG
ncbi:ankyrin repeat domain protein [Nitzschia inconspicua]|uniref:Ankyrin repeat domain protein n=1 Tax=Nitzschia inconspicua TaxID=303405 RepID=A0A9K3KRE5_9STRA|nr:ankyrin repeat domain protein [Nitzschia inconspicua]